MSMIRARWRTLAPVAWLPTILACSAPEGDGGYFPLAEGHRWEYEVRIERENLVVTTERQVMTTTGLDQLDSGVAWVRRSDAGLTYWLRSDAEGVYRVASKSDLDADPRPDKAPRFVLRQPLVRGTQWQATTTAYLLERRQEFPREIRHTHPAVPMGYVIDAVGERVEARAGRFDDCLRVRGEAQLRLFADPVQGWRDLPLTTIEWYCRNVGLVRLVRMEPAASTFLSGGTLKMELLSWK
jgi:hypothetical protein